MFESELSLSYAIVLLRNHQNYKRHFHSKWPAWLGRLSWLRLWLISMRLLLMSRRALLVSRRSWLMSWRALLMEVLIDELPVEQTSVLKNSLSKPTHYMHINHGAKQLLHAYWCDSWANQCKLPPDPHCLTLYKLFAIKINSRKLNVCSKLTLIFYWHWSRSSCSPPITNTTGSCFVTTTCVTSQSLIRPVVCRWNSSYPSDPMTSIDRVLPELHIYLRCFCPPTTRILQC